MAFEISSRTALATSIGLVDADGNPSLIGVAELFRSVLSRWGLSSRKSIVRHCAKQIDAAGLREIFPPEAVNDALDELIMRGEIQAVFVGHERFIAPSYPRWIRTSDDDGVLLGVAALPPGVQRGSPLSSTDTARRITGLSTGGVELLAMSNIEEISISEWLQPLQYRKFVHRRQDRPVRDHEMNLANYWSFLCAKASEEGSPIADDSYIRYLHGDPGGYFGRYSAPSLEGRWADEVGEGFWCAYRKGYSETHWHPCIVKSTGSERRCLDLYDHDEWKWAIIGRANLYGYVESIQQVNEEIRVSFPLPTQISTLLDLVGVSVGTWRWRVSPCFPLLRSLLD
jgi:hypothetical protein